MIPRQCKRLAEVDFPIAAVSRHAVREKSIRHGHPSTLHPWWARRPLASSRAMLLALLLPDSCDPRCPADFKEAARKALPPAFVRRAPRGRRSPGLLLAPCRHRLRRRTRLQQPGRDPARFPWREVTRVRHYWLDVDALHATGGDR